MKPHNLTGHRIWCYITLRAVVFSSTGNKMLMRWSLSVLTLRGSNGMQKSHVHLLQTWRFLSLCSMKIFPYTAFKTWHIHRHTYAYTHTYTEFDLHFPHQWDQTVYHMVLSESHLFALLVMLARGTELQSVQPVLEPGAGKKNVSRSTFLALKVQLVAFCARSNNRLDIKWYAINKLIAKLEKHNVLHEKWLFCKAIPFVS